MDEMDLTLERIDELPGFPAVYALFSPEDGNECRYVGFAPKLRETIKKHFNPFEPNIDIRYLMLSEKRKTLHYEAVPEGMSADTRQKLLEWQERYQPRKTLLRDFEALERISVFLNKHL
jgi:gas vesicle protein